VAANTRRLGSLDVTTILAAIDDSDACVPVVATAVAFARAIGAEARALHAGAGATPRPEQEAAAAGVPLVVVDRPPVTAIVEQAASPDVVAVVIAARREPAGSHEPGQTALAVLAQSTKAVLVVPPKEPVRMRPQRAIVPLDGTRAVSAVVRSTIQQLASVGFDIVILHVFDANTVPRFLDKLRDLEIWAGEFVAHNVQVPDVRLELRLGDVADATLDLASAEDPDIIVLGWRQDLSTHRAQIARRLLVETRHPILLIPLPESDD
jgi:nucleotide-binding universal stress UspA family protein